MEIPLTPVISSIIDTIIVPFSSVVLNSGLNLNKIEITKLEQFI